MFIGRKEELKQLEDIYSSSHNNLLILYGRSGIGKTCLLGRFAEDKDSIMYQAVECTGREQLNRMAAVFGTVGTDNDKDCLGIVGDYLDTDGRSEKKKLIVFDEFQYMTEDGTGFNEMIERLFGAADDTGSYMIVLVSSSINWIENSMVSELRGIARYFTGFMKLKELDFADIVEWFPKASVEDCVVIKGLLGGVPRYLSLWQENRRVKENIISLFLSSSSMLYYEAERIMKSELRELAAYNTILASLAAGRYKLNEIYSYTGFSRAKISVYLKNLIQMDVVEKIYSFDERNHENVQKGLYRIKDSYMSFYYAFVFPHTTYIEEGRGRWVYDSMIAQSFDEYMRSSFSDVCREFLILMSRYKKLDRQYEEWRSWYGKTGIIDIVGTDGKGGILASICSYRNEEMDRSYAERLSELCSLAGIKPGCRYLFSRGGFSDDIKQYAASENIALISMSDL